MKKYIYLLLALLLLMGCSDDRTNTSQPFTIKMASGIAPAFTTAVPVNARLILDVNTTLDAATVTTNTIFIQDLNGTRVHSDVTLLTPQIILRPTIYLHPNTDYEIVVSTGVQDLQGRHLQQDLVISFTSGPTVDTTPPILIGTLPGSNPNSVEPYTHLYYQFNEYISPIGIANSVITITDINTSDIITAKIQVFDKILYAIPDVNLTSDKDYNVTLDLSKISDYSGNHATGVSTITFSVYDSNLTQTPTLLPSTINPLKNINALEADDNGTLYIGAQEGLYINKFDFSTQSFTHLATLNDTSLGTIYSIEVNASQHRLYVGTQKGFGIIDTTALRHPKLLSFYPFDAPVYGTDIVGDHAYIAATLLGIIDLNISNETNLTENFTISNINSTAFDVAFDAVAGIAVADDDSNISLFDTTTHNSVLVSGATVGQSRYIIKNPNPNYSNNYLVAGGIAGVQQLDLLSTPYISNFTPPSYVRKVASLDSFIYYDLKNIGIGIIAPDNSVFANWIIPTINLSTFALMSNGSPSNSYVILADKNGQISAIKIN